MKNYIVASSKNWFFEYPKSKEYENLSIINITSKKELNIDYLSKINPRYIFFPHWSWKVDSTILNNFECIAFHTAPLPYGRGGSPIQNLIINGYEESPLCALQMTNELDAGPIYKKRNISLKGSLDEIFCRLAINCEKIILEMCENEPLPSKQKGNSYVFKRLKEEDNKLDFNLSIKEIYDRIRMVDSNEYNKAYIELGNYKIEFSKAKKTADKLIAQIKIIKSKKNP